MSDGGVNSVIDIYDSEILTIERVLEKLNEQIIGKPISIDDADKRITGLFHESGFIVTTNWWDTSERGTYIPEITIQARVKEEEFDHDRMVHEVTNDILDLGTKGVIKTGKINPENIGGHQGHGH